MPDYQRAFYSWSDRQFHELPLEGRIRTMSELDPQYAALPPQEQSSIMMEAYKKYYVDRTPPPGQEAFALLMSGIDPGDVKPVVAPPPLQMQEQPQSLPEKILAAQMSGSPFPRSQPSGVPGARMAPALQAARPVPQPASPPAAAVPPTPAAGPGPSRYGDVQILEEEPPPRVVRAPIMAGKSGRVATTPEGRMIMMPNPYDLAQPGIRTPPVPVKEAEPLLQVPPMLYMDPVRGPVMDQPPVPVTAYTRGLVNATAGTAGGLAHAAGGAFNLPALQQAGELTSAAARDISGAMPPPQNIQVSAADDPSVMVNPQWWLNIFGEAAGSMAPLLATGVGVAAAARALAGRSPQMAAALAKWGPSASGGMMEGLQAGGQEYDRAIRAGKSPEEARQQMILIAAGTAASSAAMLKAGVFTEGARRPAARIATGAATGAVEEGPLQQTWQNIVTGRPWEEGQIEAITGGALAGGAAAGALGRGPEPAPPPVSEASAAEYQAETQRTAEDIRQRRQGAPPPQPPAVQYAAPGTSLMPPPPPPPAPPAEPAPAPVAAAPAVSPPKETYALPAGEAPVQETRGKGQQYHGTSRKIDFLDEYTYNDRNIYGQGFYTTDAQDIAEGYTKKGKGTAPAVYRVVEQNPQRLFDMDAPLDNDAMRALTPVKSDYMWGILAADNPPTLRALYDEMRAQSRDEGLSTDSVQEWFDAISYNLSEQGYTGLTHTGGARTGSKPHKVNIYFNPQRDIRIEPVSAAPAQRIARVPGARIPKAAPPPVAPVPAAGPVAPMGAPREVAPPGSEFLQRWMKEHPEAAARAAPAPSSGISMAAEAIAQQQYGMAYEDLPPDIKQQVNAQPREPGVLKRVSIAGEEASARLREKGITTGEQLGAHNFADPETVRDFAVSIAGDVARGAMSFKDWSARMRSVYSDVKPAALKNIWETATSLGEAGGQPGYRPGMALDELDPSRRYVPKTTKKVKLEDVTRYLDIQTKNAIGEVPLDATPEQKMERLMQVARPEMAWQMQQPYTGQDWYDTDSPLANARIEQAFPELRENPYLNQFQKIISANFSNGQEPVQEAKYSARFWEEFRKSNFTRIPMFQANGVTRWPGRGLTPQLEKLQRMIDELGVEGAVRFVMSDQKVRDIKRFRPSVTDIGEDDDIVPGLLVIGPKIGRYYYDIMGYEQEGSTVDRWDARAHYRRLGRLIDPNTGEWIESPAPESDRDIFMGVHANLAREHGLPKASAAQSVVWHYEQELYRLLGMDLESTGRAAGAGNYLRERGIPYELSERELALGAGRAGEAVQRAGVAPVRAAVGEVPGIPARRESDIRRGAEAGGAAGGEVPASAAAAPAVPARVSGVPGARRARRPQEAGVFSRKPLPPSSPRFEFLPENKHAAEAIEAAATPPEPPESSAARLKASLTKVKEGFQRTYQKLDQNKHYPLVYQLVQARKSHDITTQKALENQLRVTYGLDANQNETVRKKLVLEDLQETYNVWKEAGELPEGADDLFELTFQVTPKMLKEELPRLNQFIEADPKVKSALAEAKRQMAEIVADYAEAMKAIGHDVSKSLTRESYLRHRVLQAIVDKDTENQLRLGGAPRVPGGRSWSKKRGVAARALPWSTDYVTSTFEVQAQMLNDTRKAKTLAWIQDPANGLNKTPELKKQAAEETKAARAQDPEAEAVDWEELIPDTHTQWWPGQKNYFYMAHTLPERIVQDLLERGVKEIGIKAEDLHKAMAMGGKVDPLVLPKEVAETLDELGAPPLDPVDSIGKATMQEWKKFMLTARHRVIGQTIRNWFGDSENTLGNINGFRKAPRSFHEIRAYVRSLKEGNPSMTPDMRSWFEHGGWQSAETVNELGDLRTNDKLEQLYKQQGVPVRGVPGARVKTLPERVIKKIIYTSPMFSMQREAILRYANYLEYLEQIRKSPDGKPENYGRSNPEQVDRLDTAEDKAYKLSNDLIGAYDETSATGQKLAKGTIPFWRYSESNLGGRKQQWINAARDEKLGALVGRKILGKAAFKAPLLAMKVGKHAIKLSLFYAALKAFNLTRDEEDKSLRREIRSRPHATLFRHEDGSIRYFPNLGNLQDLVEWADPDEWLDLYRDVLNGRTNPAKAIGKAFLGGPAEKLLMGFHPGIKTGAELIFGKQVFPDIMNLRTIYDRGEYLANSLGLGHLYRNMAGKPVPFTDKSWLERRGREALNLVSYQTDPGEGATSDIYDLTERWNREHGHADPPGGGSPDLRKDALRNMRSALRLRDKLAFVRYMAQYAAEGGTAESLNQSIEKLHPVAAIKKAERKDFLKSLNKEEKNKLDAAIEYWKDTFSGKRTREYSRAARPAARAAELQRRAKTRAAR